MIADALATGAVVDLKKAFQFFETPEALAAELVAEARMLPDHRTLEPSAGRGRIVRALLAAGVGRVRAYELQEALHAGLEALAPGRVHVLSFDGGSDFLRAPGCRSFDRIVANPPFARLQDVTHVSHMWDHLDYGGRIVSVMSPRWTFDQGSRCRRFREWLDLVPKIYSWRMLPPNSFVESGTAVSAGVIVIDRGAHAD